MSITLPQRDDQNRPADAEPSLADGPQEIDGELMGLLQVVSEAHQPFLVEQDTLVSAQQAGTPPSSSSSDSKPWMLIAPALLSGAAVAVLLLALGAALGALVLRDAPTSVPAVDKAFLVEPAREPLAPLQVEPPAAVEAPVVVAQPPVKARRPAPKKAKPVSRRSAPKAPVAKAAEPAPAPAASAPVAAPAPGPVAEPVVEVKPPPAKEPEGYMGLPSDL